MCTRKPISWEGLKAGQKFIVVTNGNSHCYPLGVVLTLKRDGTCGTSMNNVACEVHGDNLLITDIELSGYSLEQLKEQRAALEIERIAVDSKIKFCEDNGSEEFDETEYDIFIALDVLEGTGTKKEKAAMLSKLLNRK